MIKKRIHVRPGLTALGVVLTITSTSLIAQSVPPESDTNTPATSSTPPATDTTTTAPAPDSATQTPTQPAQDTAAPAEEPVAKPAKAKTTAVSARTSKAVHKAAAPAPASARIAAPAPIQTRAPAPPPVAAPSASPPPAQIAAQPAAPVAQPPKPAPWSSYWRNQANPAAAAGALGILALAGAGIGLRRRRRRLDEEEAAGWDDPTYASDESPSIEPEGDMQPAWAAAAPARQPLASAGENRLPNGFDLSRFGPHVQAAYRGPTPDNPSLSLRHRLRRAAAFDQAERRTAAQRHDSAPPTEAEQSAPADKAWMLADSESVKPSRATDEPELAL
jgi:resuscitation-promoting factor RpfA